MMASGSGGTVGGDESKIRKKEAKAAVKLAKAAAGGRASRIEGGGPRGAAFPEGVGVAIRRGEESSELVVSGLRDDQLARLLPQVRRGVLIAVVAGRSAFRAGLMRFVREGVFQTLVKVVAGLVVGYVLLRFGLR